MTYEKWKRSRIEVPVPEAFAERVMRGIETETAARENVGLLAWLAALAASRRGRLSLGALAGAAFVWRIGGVLALFQAS
jgi:hypothetical protein